MIAAAVRNLGPNVLTLWSSSFPEFHMIVLLVYLSVLLVLYMAPLAITSPCIMDRNSLKPRPDVIGRRGAPMVSPCPPTETSSCPLLSSRFM